MRFKCRAVEYGERPARITILGCGSLTGSTQNNVGVDDAHPEKVPQLGETLQKGSPRPLGGRVKMTTFYIIAL
jgi:hypothetical protein